MVSLSARLDSIERRRTSLLNEAETLGSSVLDAHPRPGKWSIREIIEHMVLAERDVLQGLPDPSHLEAQQRTLHNHLLYLLVMFILRYDIPVKAPSRGMLPAGDKSLAELSHMWTFNHTWLRSYVGSLDERRRKLAVFAHPVTGPLTIRQTLRMMDAHLDRHIRQIRRLQRMLK